MHNTNILFYFRLGAIHNLDFIHRDFHSGNILNTVVNKKWLVGDLGLSQPANNNSNNNEI